MGASPVQQLQHGQSPLSQPNAPGPTLLGLLSLLPPQFRWTYKHFYSYPTSFTPLTGSATLSSQITIDSGSHFLITYATCIVVDTTNLVQQSFIPQLVQMTDSSSQSQLFQQQMHAMAVYGDASNPGIFAIPYILTPACTFTVQHQNQDSTNVNVYIGFNGMKSYQSLDVRNMNFNR